MADFEEFREEAARLWDKNAGHWDASMGAGNRFHRELIEPTVDRLLQLKPGEHVLEVACGNGQYARHLAELGASVHAVDVSEQMVSLANQRNRLARPDGSILNFEVLDASDPGLPDHLGAQRFDAVVCNMALMDMASISPLFASAKNVLRDAGRFVFTVMHPAFNGAESVLFAEVSDVEGLRAETYGVRTTRYLNTKPHYGRAIVDQPEPQLYFHRPISQLLEAAFQVGFVVDALAEPSFETAHRSAPSHVSWDERWHEIPPVLAVRLRPR